MPEEKNKGYGEAAVGAGVLGTVANFKTVEHKVVDYKKKKVDRQIEAKRAQLGPKGTPVAQRKQLGTQYVGRSAAQKEAKRGRLKRIHGEIKGLEAKKNAIKRPYLHGNSKATWAGVALGTPLLVGGAYKTADDEVKKAHDKGDVTAALAGGVVGAGGYQVGSLAARKVDRRFERKIAADPNLRSKARAYRKESGLPKNAKPGDPGWTKYFRNYPTDLPGGKWKRGVSYATTGKTGAAVTAAAGVAGAAGAVKAKRELDERLKKTMHKDDPFEISKISTKMKLIVGAKRGGYDILGVTKPKLREAQYSGNGPIKSKAYNFARNGVRRKLEEPVKEYAQSRAVKQAAFRIVREETGKKVKQTGKKVAPLAASAGVGGAAVGAVAYSQKDEAQSAARKIVRKNLSQEQIDRRKKVQAVSSKTTGALGLGALGAQVVGEAVTRGKLKKLPTLKGGKPALETVTKPKKQGQKILDARTPLLATSAGVGSVSAFNFASYTKAEAQQNKK